ncbi:carboxylesterase family protein [Nocardia sp. NPDC052278]|uniref:carboxylesterase family protein n=1 Tax=unclassified Nocardia TaxID=2637762 RepID=UPI00368606A6
MIVETAAGKVRGSADGAVTAFRGIPFATAERFAAPRAPVPWPGIRDSVEIGPAAPQLASRLERVMGRFTVAQAEDCLSLNVWAPGGSGHPVLVFLHGGGFTSGSGGLAWYDGAELAEHGDIVVVTINYRLGVLGYLCLPGVSEGNLGLLDQMAALEWVRDNIAAFGGDPAQVTVAGQSGGALSILAMPAGTAGLFRRAILQSTPAGMPPASLEVSLVLFRNPTPDPARNAAIRYGATLSLIGAALGMLMVMPTSAQRETGSAIQGAHTVGLPDGGPGLRVLGWSTTGGDLRIPHFVGMHAVQLLPLVVIALEFGARRIPALQSARSRAALVTVAAATFGGLLAVLTWQALRGQSVVHPAAPTLLALAVIATAASGSVAVVIRRRPRSTHPSPDPMTAIGATR